MSSTGRHARAAMRRSGAVRPTAALASSCFWQADRAGEAAYAITMDGLLTTASIRPYSTCAWGGGGGRQVGGGRRQRQQQQQQRRWHSSSSSQL